MGGVIPLSDASRRPRSFPIVTAAIIAINTIVFLLELSGGDAFVNRWSLVPANIVAGHAWITILTAMFMHASWSHIIGNMIFLWAFGPEIEDAMNPVRYAIFYLLGGLAAMGAQVAVDPHSTVPSSASTLSAIAVHLGPSSKCSKICSSGDRPVIMTASSTSAPPSPEGCFSSRPHLFSTALLPANPRPLTRKPRWRR